MRCGVVCGLSAGAVAYMCAMSEGRLSLILLEAAPSAWIAMVGEARRVLMSGLAAWPDSRELVVSLRVRSVGGARCSWAVGGAVAVTGSVMVAELLTLASQQRRGRVSEVGNWKLSDDSKVCYKDSRALGCVYCRCIYTLWSKFISREAKKTGPSRRRGRENAL